MNHENVLFLNMFPDYEPPEALSSVLNQAAIVAADIDPQSRKIQVCVFAEHYIPQRLLDQAATEIASLYELRELQVVSTFPQDQLQKMEIDELMMLFVDENSMARGSLAAARWEWEENNLNVYLKANGRAVLDECVAVVCRKLQEKMRMNSF